MLNGLWFPIPPNAWLKAHGYKRVSKKIRKALKAPVAPVKAADGRNWPL